MPYCANCGTEYTQSARFCNSCGTRVSVVTSSASGVDTVSDAAPVPDAEPAPQELHAVEELTQADKRAAWTDLTSNDLTRDQLVHRRRINKRMSIFVMLPIGILCLLFALWSQLWGLLFLAVPLLFLGIASAFTDPTKVSDRTRIISDLSASPVSPTHAAPVAGIFVTGQLSDQIHKYVRQGYRIMQQTEMTVQLVKPKRFRFLWATFWFLFLGIGLLVYIFYYLAKKDDILYLEMLQDGKIRLTKQ